MSAVNLLASSPYEYFVCEVLVLLASEEQPRPIQLHKNSHATALRPRCILPDRKHGQKAGPTSA